MSRPWVNNEDGPDCYCGDPTVVKIMPDDTAVLLCFLHNREAGAVFRLPSQAPDRFPHVPLDTLIVSGQKP